ncbi:MAG TPA: hypothetical protein PK907_02560 [Candidatus Sabulitectum sp.]|nr:hypothetical protein [Candidatus Sabulitectum sp.]
MEDNIARLLELQDIDRELDRLKADIASIPGEISIHKREIEGHDERFLQQEKTLRDLEDSQKSLAGERSDTLAKISDYKSRLLSLKTNEEYSAMLSQISHAEKLIDTIDDRILEAMYLEDEARETVERARKERDRAVNRSEAREKLLLEKLEELKGRLSGLEEQRAAAAAQVEPKYLRRYEKARENGHREAVTGIRDGACGSCLTKIPAQSAGEIRGGKTFSCPICGSFVVWTSDSTI